MDDKNREEKGYGFAEIVISGSDNNTRDGGYKIPAVRPGKYAGKGAYPAARQRCEETLVFEYDAGLAFIGKVQVYTWGAKRSFYERFRADAERYRSMTGEPCGHVPFFSYIPQYSQMNLYQSKFYLYFRDMVRRGEYIHADLSYILLYIYEIINLSDESEPARDIDILCGIWMGYRDFYPVLDKYMAEWVCDYCLLYKLPVPECTLAILPKLCECATLREFYMSAAIKGGHPMRGEVLESFADYDRRRSRVELSEEYAHHFPRALEAACAVLGDEHFISGEPVTVKRDAFCGSLCAHNVKRKISVEYYPAFRRSGVRHMLGSAVKYTENKVRRAMGLKSRLHTDGLPDTVRAEIDRYFEGVMPEVFRRKTARAEVLPEYEKFYDAPDIPFSADAAQKIELESRAAAEMLVSSDDTAEDSTSVTFDAVNTETADGETENNSNTAEETASSANDYKDAIRFMLEGGELDPWCRERGLLTDSVAGEINEAAVDSFGDVLLEKAGEAWQIIDDYLEEAAEMAVE